MPFKRFVIWLIEKLLEVHLALVCVLIVMLFVPVTGDSYVSFDAFTAAVTETFRGYVDNMVYVTESFLGGSYVVYGVRTYLAGLYALVVYGYLASLYLFASLLACLLGERHYVRNAMAAFSLSAAICCARFVHAFDADRLRVIGVMLVLGLMICAVSAVIGQRLYRRWGGRAEPLPDLTQHDRSVRGGIRLDLGT